MLLGMANGSRKEMPRSRCSARGLSLKPAQRHMHSRVGKSLSSVHIVTIPCSSHGFRTLQSSCASSPQSHRTAPTLSKGHGHSPEEKRLGSRSFLKPSSRRDVVYPRSRRGRVSALGPGPELQCPRQPDFWEELSFLVLVLIPHLSLPPQSIPVILACLATKEALSSRTPSVVG